LAYQTLTAAGRTKGQSTALTSLSFARCAQNRCAAARLDAEQALSIARIEAQESLSVADALMALGLADWKTGATHDAEQILIEAIRIVKAHTAPGDPVLLYVLMEYRNYLKETHRVPEAKQIDAQLAALPHQPCLNCSVSVSGLSRATR
jgi:hypothetical protein